MICYVILCYDVMQGNEDAGQMSAWLAMSAMGIFQVCPGCGTTASTTSTTQQQRGGGEYVLTTPLFDNLTLRLPARDSDTTTSATATATASKYRICHFVCLYE